MNRIYTFEFLDWKSKQAGLSLLLIVHEILELRVGEQLNVVVVGVARAKNLFCFLMLILSLSRVLPAKFYEF